MSLDFKILWFDDQSIDGLKRDVEQILNTNYCLKLTVTNRKGNEDLSQENFDRYDLILMDYALIGAENGVEKYREIRNAHSFVDIAFYSTKMTEYKNDLKKLENEGVDIEGAYYLDLQNLTLFKERITKLIDKIVKRSESIESLRGLILDETAKFDNQAYDSIINLTQKYNLKDELEKYIVDKLHDNIVKTYNTKEENFNSASNKFDFCIDPLKGIPYLDSSNQIRLLNEITKILKSQGVTVDNELKNFYNNYQNEIIDYRNAFAHRKQNSNSIKIKDKEIHIDEAFHKSMRTTLQKYEKLFLLIENL